MKVPFIGSSPKLSWQRLKSKQKHVHDLYRTPVTGGWLITDNHGGMTFIPDENHFWDGDSLSLDK